MPWGCECGQENLDSDDLCVECGFDKTTWTVLPKKTRRFVVTKTSKLTPLRGTGEEARPEGSPPSEVDLEETEKVPALAKRAVRFLAKRGKEVPGRYLFAVRVDTVEDKPDEDRTLTLVVNSETRSEEDLVFEQPAGTTDLPSYELPFLCVFGEGDLGVEPAGVRVVDVSDDTSKGYAPSVELTGCRKFFELDVEGHDPEVVEVHPPRVRCSHGRHSSRAGVLGVVDPDEDREDAVETLPAVYTYMGEPVDPEEEGYGEYATTWGEGHVLSEKSEAALTLSEGLTPNYWVEPRRVRYEAEAGGKTHRVTVDHFPTTVESMSFNPGAGANNAVKAILEHLGKLDPKRRWDVELLCYRMVWEYQWRERPKESEREHQATLARKHVREFDPLFGISWTYRPPQLTIPEKLEDAGLAGGAYVTLFGKIGWIMTIEDDDVPQGQNDVRLESKKNEGSVYGEIGVKVGADLSLLDENVASIDIFGTTSITALTLHEEGSDGNIGLRWEGLEVTAEAEFLFGMFSKSTTWIMIEPRIWGPKEGIDISAAFAGAVGT